jgi:hypothetical protein
MGSPPEGSDAKTLHIVLTYDEGDDVIAIEQAMLTRAEPPRPRRGPVSQDLVLAGSIALITLSRALLTWVSGLQDQSLNVEVEAETRLVGKLRVKVFKGPSPDREEVVVIGPDGEKRHFAKDGDEVELASAIEAGAERGRAEQ